MERISTLTEFPPIFSLFLRALVASSSVANAITREPARCPLLVFSSEVSQYGLPITLRFSDLLKVASSVLMSSGISSLSNCRETPWHTTLWKAISRFASLNLRCLASYVNVFK